MLRRSFFYRITANVTSRPTPNPDCLQFRPMAPLGSILPPDSPPCEVPFKSISRVHPLSELLFEHYEKEVRSIFLSEDYIAVTKWGDIRWTVELERSICGVIGSFLMTNDSIPCDDSELGDFERDVGLKIDLEKDTEILQCIKELLTKEVRPMVQRDGGDIKLMEWVEQDGVLKLKMLGACKSCPSSQNTLKEGIERMLQHFVPEVKEVVEFKNQQDNMMDAISKQRMAAAAAEKEKKEKGEENEGGNTNENEDDNKNENEAITLSLNPQTITATASWNIKSEIQKQIEQLKQEQKEQVAKDVNHDADRSRGFFAPGSDRIQREIDREEMRLQKENASHTSIDPHAALSMLGGLNAEDVAASRQRELEIEKKLEEEAREKAERWAKARAQQRRKQKKTMGMLDEPEG